MYTTAHAFLEALCDAGIEYIFANLGSDHPGLIEAIAEAGAAGRAMPRVITCPNEMVALSAAHGYAQASGRAQAVFVHVECGTQALAGAVHNAAKGRVPVLIFAGASPFTQQGELKGSRTEFIHWLQDVFDQRGIVRQYMRYENELRTGVNVKQMVFRALQFAQSEPKGPVYLMGAREVMEQETVPSDVDRAHWPLLTLTPAADSFVDAVVAALEKAERPLVVTSYAGRRTEAVAALVRFAELAGAGVLESVPNYVNFPADNALYQGVQGNEPRQSTALAAADLVLVIDSDVPWIPTVNKPTDGTPVFHVDVDPLKEQMPLWQLAAKQAAKADAATVLRQLNAKLQGGRGGAFWRSRHADWARELAAREAGEGGPITAEYLTARMRRQLGEESIVLNESVTSYKAVAEGLGARRAGTLFTSGGGSLGWNGGAAIGFKLAEPGKTIVAITGDGSYMFSIPATVHWMARRYGTPFLQIVLNNGGWRAPRLSATTVHPEGYASHGADIGTSFDMPPDYGGIAAAAGGALAIKVRDRTEVDEAIATGLRAVETEGRSAVLDVLVTPTSSVL